MVTHWAFCLKFPLISRSRMKHRNRQQLRVNTHGCVYLVISVHMQYDYVLNKCRVKAQNSSTGVISSRSVISLRGGGGSGSRFFFFPLSAKMVPLTTQRVPSVQTGDGSCPSPGRPGGEGRAPSFHSQHWGPTPAVTQVGSGLLPWKPELQ